MDQIQLNKQAQKAAKVAAGKKAAELIQPGMLVGLGTGSTAECFIASLIERCKQGLKISAVASSQRSLDLALAGNIPMLDLNSLSEIDIMVDGADEIDPHKRMIKGGGGALLREKILAYMSTEVIILVDESKQVDFLGSCLLPVEITPFAYHATLVHIRDCDCEANLRLGATNKPFITENHNYIADIKFPKKRNSPEFDDMYLRGIPGILETGYFFNLATNVIVGYPDGRVEII